MSDDSSDYDALIQFLYSAPIGLVQTDADGRIEMINPLSAQLLMPLTPDGNLENLFCVLSGVAPQLRELACTFPEPSGIITEAVRIGVGANFAGGPSRQMLSISLLKLGSARLMAAITDVTAQVELEQQGLARRLNDAARIDSLTQMPNRAALRERIADLIARSAAGADGAFAVLFMNCDRFRQINDTLGHRLGDDVLHLMAARLCGALRSHDQVGRGHGQGHGGELMAARIGGDEFVVVLERLRSTEDVHLIAQRLLDLLNQPYCIGPHQIHCGVSMGIALRTPSGADADADADADAVIQDASIAMVEAKRAGGDRHVVFEPAMQERAARRGGIESELRHALAAGELFVVYQPVVELQEAEAERGPIGVEALVRWAHPARGLIPPLDFIGVAEECGLIGALGEFVLSTACHDFVGWQRDLGHAAPGRLAVNLSRAQLHLPGLVASVADALRSSGMYAGQLQLEVTESLAAQDETVQARLHELKALHLTLALDDFGTGYSSLASLHQLPVDTVKIDRSFVSQSDHSHHHRVLIEATVRVATSLGMSTVAEGIETRAQHEVVRRLGCDKGQGYYYSKPLEAPQLRGWLAARHADEVSDSQTVLTRRVTRA